MSSLSNPNYWANANICVSKYPLENLQTTQPNNRCMNLFLFNLLYLCIDFRRIVEPIVIACGIWLALINMCMAQFNFIFARICILLSELIHWIYEYTFLLTTTNIDHELILSYLSKYSSKLNICSVTRIFI